MAEDILTVQEMVDAELERDPSVSLEDLRWLAARIDAGVEELAEEEFRARFLSSRAPAPTKPGPEIDAGHREAPTEEPPTGSDGPPRGTPTEEPPLEKDRPHREARTAKAPPPRTRAERAAPPPVASPAFLDLVRTSLFAFAEEVSAAETPHEVVRVIAEVDRHVERILRGR